ncbi:MAG: glutamyl-tRNA reductase [bacterium]
MNILLTGLNHKTTPVEIRERLAFPPKQRGAALAQLTQPNGQTGCELLEAVILSTCNRVEIYTANRNNESAIEKVKSFLSNFHNVPPAEFSPYLYTAANLDAVEHLFNVTSGIDSMMIGETQIQGQVKQAFECAQQHGTAGTFLSALFRHALSVGKRVRTETAISEHSLSISRAAVNLVQKSFPNVAGLKVVVVGVGEMGLVTIKSLFNQGVRDITAINRSQERAQALVQQFNLKTLGFDRLEACLAEADVVVSCTGAPHIVLPLETVKRVLRHRQKPPLLIVDIAVPRDVDPQVGKLENVRLHNIDQLRTEVEQNLKRRSNEIGHVRAIVTQEVSKFFAWYQSREAKPVITKLRQKAEQIREQELQRALRRFESNLSDSDTRVVQDLSRRIINRILHQPLTRLKELTAEDNGELYAATVRNLFRLEEPSK